MVTLAQGRVAADTDAERIILEIRRFDAQVATEVLRQITDMVRQRRDGWVQLQVRLKGGSITGYQSVINYAKDLDAEHPE